MRLFWDIVIEPVLAAARPERIVEIGVDQGLTTERLVAFAESRGAFLEAIDPEPKIDTAVWEREHPDTVRFHRGLSVDVLPGSGTRGGCSHRRRSQLAHRAQRADAARARGPRA